MFAYVQEKLYHDVEMVFEILILIKLNKYYILVQNCAKLKLLIQLLANLKSLYFAWHQHNTLNNLKPVKYINLVIKISICEIYAIWNDVF